MCVLVPGQMGGGEYSSANWENWEGLRRCSALGGVSRSYGPVPIKTDFNQSYCSYLETSATVAKHELKLSDKSVQTLQ